MKAPNQLYIDGEWRPAADGATIDVVDPATEDVVDEIPRATISDLDDALAAAERGFSTWRETDAWTRSAALRRVAELVAERAEQIARVMTEEEGKPLAESRAEANSCAEQFDWFADEARRVYGRLIDGNNRRARLMVMRQPIGPVAAFTPWNFPVLLPARKLAPALAAGCSVILKPAEEAPRTALCLAQACHDAGIPPGVVNVVTGEPAEISSHLIASDVIRKVTLTGSIPVGKELMRLAAEGVKPVTMELGGHSPVLVFADADVERAAQVSVTAKFRNTGQVCVSPSRFLVHESLAEPFTETFVERVQAVRLGPGSDPQTEVGPLANRRRLDAMDALVGDAVGKGAVVRVGGRRPEAFDRGLFYEPTVLTDVDESMELMTTEPFGPVAPITSFADVDEALERANATPYGLAGYVFTRDLRTAFLASEGLDVGMVGVNNLVISRPEAPFGGVKLSGFGREGGTEWVESYTTAKYVNMLL